MNMRIATLLLILLALRPSSGAGAQTPFDDAVTRATPKSNVCPQTQSSNVPCPGFVGARWKGRDDARERPRQDAANALMQIGALLPKPTDFIDRVTREAGRHQAIAIQSVPGSERIAIRQLGDEPELGARGLVIARLRVADMSASAGTDMWYGVGPQADAQHPAGETHFQQDFYLVLIDFDGTDMNETHDGFRVSRWEVWGIDSLRPNSAHPVLVARRTLTKDHGKFRVCSRPHPNQSTRPATFDECLPAHNWQKLLVDSVNLRNKLGDRALAAQIMPYLTTVKARSGATRRSYFDRSTVESALISLLRDKGIRVAQGSRPFRIMLNTLIAADNKPAWMPCGVGCCIADS